MIAALLAWVDRQGGMLVAPRRTLAALHPDEGRRDGTWLLVVYVLAAHVDDVVAAIARMMALRSISALPAAVVDVAIGLVAPFVTLFAVELVLGRERAHRAPLLLAPMLAIAVVLHLAVSFGGMRWAWQWLPGAIAGAPCLLFAWRVKDAIPPRASGGGE
jgi:hypothetical protein